MRARTVTYDAPARFDDLPGGARPHQAPRPSEREPEYCAVRVADDVLMCTAEQTPVLVALEDRRPVSVPGGYRAALEQFEGAIPSRR